MTTVALKAPASTGLFSAVAAFFGAASEVFAEARAMERDAHQRYPFLIG